MCFCGHFFSQRSSKFLAERTERIENQLKDAEAKTAEALELKQTYEQHIEAFEAEGREIIRVSQTKAAREAEAIVRDARNQAEQLVADANERIAVDKARALAEARTEVALSGNGDRRARLKARGQRRGLNGPSRRIISATVRRGINEQTGTAYRIAL